MWSDTGVTFGVRLLLSTLLLLAHEVNSQDGSKGDKQKPPDPNTTDPRQGGGGGGGGSATYIIVGCIVGVLVLITIVAVVVCLYKRRKQHKPDETRNIHTASRPRMELPESSIAPPPYTPGPMGHAYRNTAGPTGYEDVELPRPAKYGDVQVPSLPEKTRSTVPPPSTIASPSSPSSEYHPYEQIQGASLRGQSSPPSEHVYEHI